MLQQTNKITKMKTLELTSSAYLKKLELGYYEYVECISMYIKKVSVLNLNGTKELCLIKLLK